MISLQYLNAIHHAKLWASFNNLVFNLNFVINPWLSRLSHLKRQLYHFPVYYDLFHTKKIHYLATDIFRDRPLQSARWRLQPGSSHALGLPNSTRSDDIHEQRNGLLPLADCILCSQLHQQPALWWRRLLSLAGKEVSKKFLSAKNEKYRKRHLAQLWFIYGIVYFIICQVWWCIQVLIHTQSMAA